MAEGGNISFTSGSEFIYDFYCEFCVEEGQHLEAYGFCAHCKEYLCEECYHAHKRSRASRQHVLLDKSNMPKDSPLPSDRVSKMISTRCRSHNENVKFYCKSHENFGCSTCIATSHRNCPDVDNILEKSENVLESQEYKSFITELKSMMTTSEYLTKEVIALSERIEAVYIEIDNLCSSGRVCQLYIKMKEAKEEVLSLKESLRNAEKQVHEPSNMRATEDCEINVGSSDQSSTCWLTGSAVMSKNRVIFIDYNNNRVKLVDSRSNTVISELQVSFRPWDVTAISPTEAAVTVSGSGKVLLLRVGDTLAVKGELTVSRLCQGIAYSEGKLMVTYGDNNPRLEIVDLRGNVIKRIDNDKDGRKLFTYPEYVCVGKDGKTMYVSDVERHAVTSLTCEGVVLSVYTDVNLKNPRKMCTDHHGTVYVCGWENKNVHMITAHCKKVKLILTQADGLVSSVRSVSHCQDTNRLFIGMDNDKVKVYQLS